MAAPYHKAMRKTEDAVESVIKSLRDTFLEGVTFFKGFSFAELTVPRIEILAMECEPQKLGRTPSGGYFTGNFHVTLAIAVVAHKNDVTRGVFAKYCAAVEDAIMRDDFEELANNSDDVTDFTMFKPGWWPGNCQSAIDGDHAIVTYAAVAFMKPSISED